MRRIRSGVKALARRAGVEVARHDPWALPAARRGRLLKEGRFELVLDVGANSGQYGRELREHGYRGAIVSFEPGGNAFELLEQATAGDPRWSSRRLALGERSGRRSINVATNDGASSSFLALADAHRGSVGVRYEGMEDVDMASLDDLAVELLPVKGPVWLKLDVQGYEQRVLDGAEATLPRLSGLELELSFAQLYEGQPLFDELLRFVQDAGFRTVDVSPEFVDPATGRMLQANLFALRP